MKAVICALLLALTIMTLPTMGADEQRTDVSKASDAAERLIELGRRDDAEIVIEQALLTCFDKPGKERISLRLTNQLIRVYYSKNKLKEAKPLFKLCLGYISELRGRDSVEFSQALVNYAALCQKLQANKDAQEAINLFKKIQKEISDDTQRQLRQDIQRIARLEQEIATVESSRRYLLQYLEERDSQRMRDYEWQQQEQRRLVEASRRQRVKEASAQTANPETYAPQYSYSPTSTTSNGYSSAERYEDPRDPTKYYEHGRQYGKFGDGGTVYGPGVNQTPGVNSVFGK